MDDEMVAITRGQLRTLLEGLHIWNTICLDSLTEKGRIKLYAAQDLVERLWSESAQEGGG